MTMKRILGITLLCTLLLAGPVLAKEKINVAVAANFITAFQDISRSFEVKTGIPVEATYSSTGQLYAQIVNGAPYDLFLSADEERPALLYREGRAEHPFVYAEGQVVLWTIRKDLCGHKNWREVMATPVLKKIAVANPKTAPYGAASMTALKNANILENVQEKLVFAQNIAQVFQYAATGSVDAGFCALSSALSEEGRKGCFFSVDEAPPIVQSACLLKAKLNVYKRTTRQKAAGEFIRFLSSPEATAIKKKYGYR
jgi:molybdate transport system substrate-binding protein